MMFFRFLDMIGAHMADLLTLYEDTKKKLQSAGFVVNPYRDIQYGIQFLVFFQKKNGVIRLYQSKKGLKWDLSQVDKDLVPEIRDLLDTPQPAPLVPFDFSQKKTSTDDLSTIDTIIGIDESGKGDYFGPLVVAAVHVTPKSKRFLKQLGVMDSKDLSDNYIEEISPEIKKHCAHSLVIMGNQSYNDIYEKIKNLNHILAWGHARVLENVLKQVDCEFALSDQFGNPALVQNALMQKGQQVKLFQQPKAESHIAVAAASILARNGFVNAIRKLETAFGMPFPKGCSVETVRAAKAFVKRYGEQNLALVAKTHFKITAQLKDD